MINVLDYYNTNQSSLGFSTDPNVWPTEVLLYILNNVPNESVLFYPEGNYNFNVSTPPIVINRPIIISGEGTPGTEIGLQGTAFNLYKSIIVQSENVIFENLLIRRYASGALDGILSIQSPNISLRNIIFFNQGQKTTPAIFITTSASHWHLENIDIIGFQTGLKNYGNYGNCINLTVSNGEYGIDDNCSEGSTYVACRTTGNSEIGIRCLQRGLFTGCFADDKVEIRDDAFWVGGNLDYEQVSEDNSGMVFTKNAFKQFQDRAIGTQLQRNEQADTSAHFFAGGKQNTIFEFPSGENIHSSPYWQLIFDSQEINYQLGLFGETSALYFSATDPVSVPAFMDSGKIGLPRGYYIGHLTGFIFVRSDVAKPGPSEGRKGDRVMNRTPKVKPITQTVILDENYMGWICIKSAVNGQGAIWKGFGLLE